ncbi:MAG: hypothetical protein HY002_03335 [Candidatus Rokubacteria bacterium]|nr:hypothetical protein [Candidatus Rokubacteria bacterium]
MPIEAGTLEATARIFCDHLNHVVNRTVSQTRLVWFHVEGQPLGEITFRQTGAPTRARLRTRFGPMWLSLGQLCGSIVQPGGLHRLYTAKYKYTITRDGTEEPLLRWEYVRRYPSPDDRWCRHHLQGNVRLGLYDGATELTLDALHVPTGFTTVEEVLRFCITDLGVNPLSADWDRILTESYERFKTDFTSWREP